MKIDDKDWLILSLLERDGKQTSQQLADAIHVSSAAVWRRVKALEEAGIIKGYQAIVDYEVLEQGLTIFVSLTLKRHSADTVRLFEEKVMLVDEVLDCYSITGQADYILKIRVGAIRDYETVLNDKIFQLPGVDHVQSSIGLREIK